MEHKFENHDDRIERVAPLLRKMRWRRIRAGHDRLRDIDAFINNYRMYAPLLAEKMMELEQAHGSEMFNEFDLYASARYIAVKAIDAKGKEKLVILIPKHYWDTIPPFDPRRHTPW